MTFASEGNVIDDKLLQGFHTIVTLDAVLSLTHALMDMHYQNLKDSVTAAGYYRNGVSPYLPTNILTCRHTHLYTCLMYLYMCIVMSFLKVKPFFCDVRSYM